MSDILGKIVGGLNKGVATVGASSKALMEKTQVKAAISNIENEGRQILLMIGQTAVDMYMSDGRLELNDDMEALIAQLLKKEDQLMQKQEQLRQIDEELSLVIGRNNIAPVSVAPSGVVAGGIVCGCGHTNASSTKFCIQCGAKVEDVIQQPIPQDGVLCSCGNVCPDGTAFCGKCGSKLG